MDLIDPISNDSVEEREDDMSNLAVGFDARAQAGCECLRGNYPQLRCTKRQAPKIVWSK